MCRQGFSRSSAPEQGLVLSLFNTTVMKKHLSDLFMQVWMLFAILFIPLSLYAQETVVKGRVVSSEKNEPLTGVTVRLKNGNTGAVTDLNGWFSLTVKQPSPVLVFSFTGYLQQEMPVNG